MVSKTLVMMLLKRAYNAELKRIGTIGGTRKEQNLRKCRHRLDTLRAALREVHQMSSAPCACCNIRLNSLVGALTGESKATG